MHETIEHPRWYWPRSAYIHVPFCVHRCGYCDFAIAVGQDTKIDAYLGALETELRTLGEPQLVETLFLGGGTPTYLDVARLLRLFEMLRHWLPVAPDGELSIEANPETISAEKSALLAEVGVNRVSLGAQSFDAAILAKLERPHRAEQTHRAYEFLRSKIDKLSLDLIFGVHEQTQEQWDADLRQALTLEPDHVSTYGLTYEQGTPLWKRRERGQIRSLSEQSERTLYAHTIDTLERAGFEHYEISNFARHNSRSRHNQVYWANEAYFGFGMGAARYVCGRRELNARNLDVYLSRVAAGESAIVESEALEPFERARETMAMQLRRMEGIDRETFLRQTGFPLDAVAARDSEGTSRIEELERQGFLQVDQLGIRLTREGKFVADAVIARLL